MSLIEVENDLEKWCNIQGFTDYYEMLRGEDLEITTLEQLMKLDESEMEEKCKILQLEENIKSKFKRAVKDLNNANSKNSDFQVLEFLLQKKKKKKIKNKK